MNINKSSFIILALALLCGGCSVARLGYDHADWLLNYRINGYTSFNAQQKEQIRLEVEDYMRWHRKYALPEYITFLQNLNRSVSSGALTVDDVMRLRAESSMVYKLTIAPMIPPAAQVLGTLDSTQIAELGGTFAQRNGKQKKKLLRDSDQQMLDMRVERHIDFLERLAGNLSGEQEEKITEMSLGIPFATRHYIAQREAKHASLLAMLNGHAAENNIAALFQQWLDMPESPRSPQQQQAIAAYESAMNEMTVQIFGLLTMRQKQHLSEKIMSYIEDFQKLSPVVGVPNLSRTSSLHPHPPP